MATTQTIACPYPSAEKDGQIEVMACPVRLSEDSDRPRIHEAIDKSKLAKIPAPRHQNYFGLLGHAPDLDPILPVRSYWKLMDTFGPIFQLDLGMTHPRVFVGSRELVNEMADDDRFSKFTHRLHKEMRPVFGDGLFSAESTDRAWWKAHRLLVPSFGPIGLSKMFDDMQDLSAQLVLKWDRFGPEHEIECVEDMARLAFDTVGLCAFGYRFNEFYSEEPHPFMVQLKESIVESGRRANRPEMLNQFYYREEQHRQDNIAKMKELCKKIIKDRIENPKPDAKDLLNTMLNGIDRETGEKLSIENVEYQIPTFLGAGYETTSATLAFIYYFLCNNPETIRKAQEEIDSVVGEKVLTFEMLSQLKYLDACIKEALRIQHPSSLLTRFATRDTVIGGKYFINKGQMVSGVWRHFHRDPKIWGEDADEFRPERMLDFNFKALPPNSWKPFGDGQRACIGRGFAEQEMLINMAMVLQKFDLEKVHPDYELSLRGQMAVKPIGFKIRVRRRQGRSLMIGIPGGGVSQQHQNARKSQPQERTSVMNETKKPISVFFGGNMGTSESLAQSLSGSAPDFRLDVVDIQELDAAYENLPIDRPVVIITPSYDGRPPDNGKKFVSWIEKLASKGQRLPIGIKFAVFGLGNSDWVDTFHRIPRLIDETLEKIGAERIIDTGFANVKQDLVGPWEAWSEHLLMNLSGSSTADFTDRAGVDVHIESNNLGALPQIVGGEQMVNGIIVANHELADAEVGAAKQHVEIKLPKGNKYRSGDYLVVQGRNSEESVSRVMKRFGLSAEDVMSVQSSKKDFLPALPMAIEHFLRSSVELASPITKRQIATLVSHAAEGTAEHTQLDKMHEDHAYRQLLNRRYSIIDVLEEVPQLSLPFGVYIDLLLPLAPRLYSISSSPLDPKSRSRNEMTASITFDILESPAMSGHGTFRGVASSYLANRKVGDNISCAFRSTTVPFQLPSDPKTPVVMLAAGSGIAPMRAFIQERAAIKKTTKEKLGPALLFFGCRHPDKDFMYRSELEAWEKAGIVEVVTCFSKPEDSHKGRHVPEAMWEHRERLWELFQDGAKFFTCGSAARLGRSSAEMWRHICRDKTSKTEVEAHEWFDQIKNDRYVSDVY